MSKNSTTNLIKDPYVKTHFPDQKALDDFIKCCDPNVGHLHFMDNFFYIQHPTKGSMLYHPWPYQKRLIETYHNYRYSISLMPRQSGKSTTAAGYLLWYAMFIPDSTILIAAHKYTGAQEIMQRIRYAYENCPDYIKAGVTTYNKGSLDFENGSRIVSATTTENTGRGMSISLLYCLDGDTSFVKVRNKQTLVEEDISLKELFVRLCELPVHRQFTFVENAEYEILTPDRWKDFRGVTTTSKKLTFKIELATGETVSATENHFFFVDGIKVQVKNLKITDSIDTITGPVLIKSITQDKYTTVYDIVEVDQLEHKFIVNHCFITKNCDEFAFVRPSIAQEFWTSIAPTLATGGKAIITSTPNSDEDQFALIWKGANKIEDEYGNQTELGVNGFKAYKSHWKEQPGRDDKWADEMRAQLGDDKFRREIGLEFIIADETLIAPTTLIDLEGIEPISRSGQIRWYKKPEPGNIYVVALDPSLGTGGDPAAIQIFEANTTTQIGEWKHNKTDIPKQIKLITDINKHIIEYTNEPDNLYYSIENNSIGEAALISLNEYGEHNIPGTFLSEAGKKRKGFNTSHKVKLTACAKFKTLVENKKLKIYSKALISEMKSFIASGGSYAAKTGDTDDLVMATLLVVRMITHLSDYHSNLEDRIRDHNEFIAPLPFFAVIS